MECTQDTIKEIERIRSGENWEIVPILVRFKYEGNVGSVARLARNYGLSGIILVDPPPLGDEAVAYSMHGSGLLKDAAVVPTLKEASESVDFLVGTSGISESGVKNHPRRPMTPEELSRWSRGVTGSIGIVLGREDTGLSIEELRECDMLVTIPASPEYPILNVSHAAAILLYELWKGRMPDYRVCARTMNETEKRVLMRKYEELLHLCGVQPHKVPISMINFRRMICRSSPNVREFYSLMGTLSRAAERKASVEDETHP
ncbi:MAG: TrmJ/YjtD family RNA methyltransferase [Candidatus Thermoplasmatota archaeon]|nr:TrmJ/YjtD family RNA methyltransferase [Candidatus Thermoplasmatota archaeon]